MFYIFFPLSVMYWLNLKPAKIGSLESVSMMQTLRLLLSIRIGQKHVQKCRHRSSLIRVRGSTLFFMINVMAICTSPLNHGSQGKLT